MGTPATPTSPLKRVWDEVGPELQQCLYGSDELERAHIATYLLEIVYRDAKEWGAFGEEKSLGKVVNTAVEHEGWVRNYREEQEARTR